MKTVWTFIDLLCVTYRPVRAITKLSGPRRRSIEITGHGNISLGNAGIDDMDFEN